MKPYLKYILLSTILAAILLAWNNFTPLKLHHPYSWVILCFFVVSSPLIHFAIKRSANDGAAFIRMYMAITSLKLLLYMALIVLYALFNKETAVSFILHFFVMYLVFTTFETINLYKELRQNK